MINRRLRAVLLSVAVLALMASAASAQLVENAMRGATVVAAPTASAAWVFNPAMLGAAAAAPADPFAASGMQHSASVDVEVSGDSDLFAVNWGGAQVGSGLGFGAGYWDMSGGKVYGLGVGKALGSVAVGLNWSRYDFDTNGVSVESVSDRDLFALGVGGSLVMGAAQGGSAAWGVVVRDLLDEFKRYFDVGLAFSLQDGTLLAVDVSDVTDEIDRTFHIGAAKRFGSANEFLVGVGLDDGDLTLGALYDLSDIGASGNWKIGVAWMDGSDGAKDSLLVGAAGTWGF